MAAVTIRDLAADAKDIVTGACDHRDAELVSTGREAKYLRCGCGALLAIQGGQTWIVRPASS